MTPIALSVYEEASREARALAADASEAVQEGVQAAERTYRIGRRYAENAVDDATISIRRRPFAAVGVAMGMGIVVGAAGALVAWLGAHYWRRRI